MAETNLGRVAIVPQGTYSASVQYYYLDLVYYNGSSYLVHTQPTIGTLPIDTDYWYLVAEGTEIEMRYDAVTDYIQWKLVTDSTWTNLIQSADFNPTIVQITGTSTTDVMSQNSVTNELALKTDAHLFNLLAQEGKNKFDNTKLISSYWIDAAGAVVDIGNTAFKVTQPIAISEGNWTLSGYAAMSAELGHRYTIKDISGTVLQFALLTATTTVIAAPADSATIQFAYERPGSELNGLNCQLESGSVATTYEAYGYFIDEDKVIFDDEFIYTLPDTINVAVGRECNIYKDNITDRIPDKSGFFETTFTKSTADSEFRDMQRGARYLPTSVKSVTTSAKIRKGLNANLLTKNVIFNAVSKTAGSGTKNVLFIGDSLLAYGAISGEVLSLFNTDGGGAIALMGHIGSGTNKYEARGGWSMANYATNQRKRYYLTVVGFNVAFNMVTDYIMIGSTYYRIDKWSLDGSGNGTIELTLDSGLDTIPASGTFTHIGGGGLTYNYTYTGSDDTGNPFWNPNTSLWAAFPWVDFHKYMADYNAGASLNVVVIQLGINDIYGGTDPQLVANYCQRLRDVLYTQYPTCELIISLPPFAPYSDGYSGFRGYLELLTYRKNMFDFYKKLELLADSVTSIAYSNLWIDRLYGYAPTEVVVNARTTLTEIECGGGANDVHPSTEGSNQIADCIYSQIRAVL